MIVRPHPGPTHQSNLRLDWEVQFFTSRGFAVVDVDYRGSTGYGREFRKALDGNWGRFDVEDCRTVALHLIENGSARRDAVFISGASAGGYTALRAVCEDGPFTLAVARSAIVDPERWTVTAPRFQRPHAAVLAGGDAKVAATKVLRPVLLIHGVEDPVAPIGDVSELADALDDRQLLVRMIRLDGIGHYLSDAATLSAALEAEVEAYLDVLRDAGISLGLTRFDGQGRCVDLS
ncbi:alpha/beta hydrolase family protein [Micromonospora sp. NBC_01796]|uniref:alpha/beta hydrolase family protein n=1 Tax=Micromonospora sp. NBC_01796 TaxID=2975987 RepID=UPI002DD894C1|nr:prolyl oligopeptidase family serine peptidase [Micromonospora sp. NBC_01796]